MERGEESNDRVTTLPRDAQARIFKTIVDLANYGNVITDPAGVIIYCNAFFARRHGYAPEELLGANLALVLEEEQRDGRGLIETLLQARASHGFLETRHRHRNGTVFIMLMSGLSLEDADGSPRFCAVTAMDVSRERELESQLRHAVKMEAVGTLAGGIAHDFNNILGAMLGYTRMAMDGLSPDQLPYRDLEKVLAAGDRAVQLVRQLLLFSRGRETGLERIMPAFLVKEAGRMLRETMPATIQVHLQIDEQCPAIMADLHLLYQVLMNLVANSVEAMRDGGRLTIVLCEADPPVDDIPGPLRRVADSWVEIGVSDTGAGMDEEQQSHVFEPFYTSKTADKRSGLGLSVVHGIVRSHGGWVRVRSVLGEGSTFSVFLPAIPPVTENRADIAVPEPGGGEHLLVVDDEEEIVLLQERLLTALGYQVSPFVSSQEAWAYFSSHFGEVDLLVTDLTMPVMDGWSLAARVHDLKDNLPVILCTGFSESIALEEARARGVSEILYKPVNKETLAGVIRKVLDERAHTGS